MLVGDQWRRSRQTCRDPMLGVCELLQALQQMPEKAMPEWAAFAYSLAARLQEEHRSNRLTPGNAVWQLGMEQLLLPSVDSDLMVRPLKIAMRHQIMSEPCQVPLQLIGVSLVAPALSQSMECTLNVMMESNIALCADLHWSPAFPVLPEGS